MGQGLYDILCLCVTGGPHNKGVASSASSQFARPSILNGDRMSISIRSQIIPSLCLCVFLELSFVLYQFMLKFLVSWKTS